MTRAVFAFAELTNADPQYRGPEFDFDRIVKDLMNKVRNNGGLNMMDDRFVSAISKFITATKKSFACVKTV